MFNKTLRFKLKGIVFHGLLLPFIDSLLRQNCYKFDFDLTPIHFFFDFGRSYDSYQNEG